MSTLAVNSSQWFPFLTKPIYNNPVTSQKGEIETSMKRMYPPRDLDVTSHKGLLQHFASCELEKKQHGKISSDRRLKIIVKKRKSFIKT